MKNEDLIKASEIMREHYFEVCKLDVIEILLFFNADRFISAKRQSSLFKLLERENLLFVTPVEMCRKLSYEEFKKKTSEITCLGFYLLLYYQCGIDWMDSGNPIKQF